MEERRLPEPGSFHTWGVDRMLLRLALVGILVVAMFTVLFSRLWFLQVLASDEFEELARDNRVRLLHSEPHRGRILSREGKVLADNRSSLSVTIDRLVFDDLDRRRIVLQRLSRLLDVPAREMKARLEDVTVSPYKPVAVANDVPVAAAIAIRERSDRFPGVAVETRPLRHYPQGRWAAQVLGYVGEISPEQLEIPYFADARRPYEPGDVVGKMGVERSYDRQLRGRPRVETVTVDATGKPVGPPEETRPETPGKDIVLSLNLRIQKVAERALASGIRAARRRYDAPSGGAVVLDPRDGAVLAMASFPSYDPAILADGISVKEFRSLGMRTPNDPSDDALVNRPMQQAVPPGSTFKTVTAGAAMANGIASPASTFRCPPARTLGSVTFRNWSPRDFGTMDIARSLEVSCDTVYYDLGWELERRFGASLGNGSERFQSFIRASGLGAPTGVDLPGETGGRVPDQSWCRAIRRDTKGELCRFGWLPGYTVNLSIGQGDLIASPLQMAVHYAALANGGKLWQPRVMRAVAVPGSGAKGDVRRRLRPRLRGRLPLKRAQLAVIRRGLEQVVMRRSGTARGAFAGFPLDRHPVAGKTGTAQIGSVDSGENYAWFVSYAPARRARFVVAVYLERAGHGGESAAPIARQIYEGIFRIDERQRVRLARDTSG